MLAHSFTKAPRSLTLMLLCITLVMVTLSEAQAQSFLGETTSSVKLREGPGKEYSVIRVIDEKAHVFVVSRTATSRYVNVIHVQSGNEGWIHENYVTILAEVPKSTEGVFTPTGQTNSQKAEVLVHNMTSLIVTLSLNGQSYSLQPDQKRTLRLSPGQYSYRAHAPGVIPYYGDDFLAAGSRYSWGFYIETVRR